MIGLSSTETARPGFCFRSQRGRRSGEPRESRSGRGAVAPTERPGACARAWLRARYTPSVGPETRAAGAAARSNRSNPREALALALQPRRERQNRVPNFVPDSAMMTLAKPG